MELLVVVLLILEVNYLLVDFVNFIFFLSLVAMVIFKLLVVFQLYKDFIHLLKGDYFYLLSELKCDQKELDNIIEDSLQF